MLGRLVVLGSVSALTVFACATGERLSESTGATTPDASTDSSSGGGAGTGSSGSGGAASASGAGGGGGSSGGSTGDAALGTGGALSGDAAVPLDAPPPPDCANPDEKRCGGLCLPPSPGIGCSLSDCTPCPEVSNGTRFCTDDQCDFDCESGYIKGSSGCVLPGECTDGVQNGTETAPDCGGATCPGCPPGEACQVDGDCDRGPCTGGVCGCSPATCSSLGSACGNGLDDGCGGTVDCSCPGAQSCYQGSCCTRTSCAATECGSLPDGCGGFKSCGTCQPSCLALLTAGATTDGTYTIDPDGAGPITPFDVFCDMTTDGGGWTEITLNLARNSLGGTLVAADAGNTDGFDGSHRPFATATGSGSTIVTFTYHYTFDFPPGYDEFYLNGYELRANNPGGGTSEINPATWSGQTNWSTANLPVPVCQVGQVGNVGDVSFGSPDQAGPITSFAARGAAFECSGCTFPWPANGTVFSLPSTATRFRIGFGEALCGQSEGWYPWWTGTIRLR